MTHRAGLATAIVGLVSLGCHHTFIELNPDAPGADRGTDAGDGDGGADAAEDASADAESGDEDAAGEDVSDEDSADGDGGGVVVFPAPPCGNGMLDDGEQCDDGNRQNADGCTWECLLGDGSPPGPRDPAARPYRVDGLPVVLPSAESPTVPPPADAGLSRLADGILVASWSRPEVAGGPPGMIWSRFLNPDGAMSRADVGVGLASGWRARELVQATSASEVLLAWHVESRGMWRSRLTAGDGVVEVPTSLGMALTSEFPALAAQPGGYAISWYDGSDATPCYHEVGSLPSRVLLGRLVPEGTLDATRLPVEIESDLGARTAPQLAAAADGSVGLLWWRSATERDVGCSLRFGVSDAAAATLADGGVVGPSSSGSVVDEADAFRAVWIDSSETAPQRLSFAAFDRGAMLLDAPTTCELPFDDFWRNVELAAGDHGLVAALRGYSAADGVRLFFVRTDLLGRTGDALCGAVEVDPSCTAALGCEPGVFGVAWAGDAFVIVYFVTLDPGGPSPTTEMRMVRLVPAS